MDYDRAIELLENLEQGKIKPRLENIAEMAHALKDPQNQFKSIHIAGTNGKGSVAAMIESILRANGYKTGLYTSPHIFDFTERIRVNGREISPAEVSQLVEELLPFIQKYSCTYFEASTMMAFLYFARMGIDVAVVETGLGGRLDATNILDPMVSVITKIGYDHQDYLGSTLEEIAFEKAGIIKPHVPCVIGEQRDGISDFLEAQAHKMNSPVSLIGRDIHVHAIDSSVYWNHFDFEFDESSFPGVSIPLVGDFQVSNAGAALAAITWFSRKSGLFFHPQRTRFGLKYCVWEGRFEKINNTPPVIVDVGHNPDAFEALRRTLEDIFPNRKIVLIFGVLRDKAYKDMLRIILPVCRAVVGIVLPSPRALHPENLIQFFAHESIPYKYFDCENDAFTGAISLREPDDILVAAGSHFTVKMMKSVIQLRERNFEKTLDNVEKIM